MTFSRERVLIIGGSSGMGLALAERLLAKSCEVTIAGRSGDKLAAAQKALGPVRTHATDIGSEDSLKALFAQTGPLDHIVVTAADIRGAYQLLPDLGLDAIRRAIDSKVVGPLLVAKHGAPNLSPGGSLTFTSGIAAYRPSPRGTVVAAINGALESLVYALAVELAPIRANVVSPGWTDTPIWDTIAGDQRAAYLDGMAERLPVGRVGQASDMADAIDFLMHNGFTNGTLLHVDGGHRFV